MKWLSAVLPFLLAPPLLILAAIWQGKETERWGEFPEMKQFAARLEKLPVDIGPWHGERGPGLKESMRKAAGAEGDYQIVFTNDKHEKVDVFIVCGRLLDMSKHRPDRCYPAQGYKADGEETKLQKVAIGPKSKADFRTAVYSKEDEGIKTRIYWSWASDRVWKAPDGEDGLRKEFRRTKPIYKLYVDDQVSGPNQRTDEGPCIDLIKVLVPAYDKILFPEADKATADKPNQAEAATPAKPVNG